MCIGKEISKLAVWEHQLVCRVIASWLWTVLLIVCGHAHSVGRASALISELRIWSVLDCDQ